jgi:hypothetical protein
MEAWASVGGGALDRRYGHTATLWRDTVVVIGGRDGCAQRRAAAGSVPWHCLTRRVCAPRGARARRRSDTFPTDVLLYDMQRRTWAKAAGCAPAARS